MIFKPVDDVVRVPNGSALEVGALRNSCFALPSGGSESRMIYGQTSAYRILLIKEGLGSIISG